LSTLRHIYGNKAVNQRVSREEVTGENPFFRISDCRCRIVETKKGVHTT
jgi:hypothetical protein